MLVGGTGNDLLQGSSGNDSLKGNGGNDTLLGGSGEDSLFGNEGNDELSGGRSSDQLDRGAGTGDRLKETGDLTFPNFVLSNTQLQATFNPQVTESDTLTGFEAATLTGNTSSNSISAMSFTGALGTVLDAGGNGTDTLIGSAMSDVINGGIGRDSILGNAGDDTINGSRGNDTVLGG